MSEENLEVMTPKHLQIFTLARAVRPGKKSFSISNEKSNKPNEPVKSTISVQIKKTLKAKHETTTRRQPKSRLPLKMVVSKMATRNPISDENKDAQDDLDTSIYRHFNMAPPSLRNKLEPPSWRNKMHQTRRRHTSKMQKLIDDMKEKCAQFDSSFRDDSSTLGRGLRHHTSKYDRREADPMSTPRLRYNYNQLYGARQESAKHETPLTCEGEDPLGFESETPTVEQEMSEEPFKIQPTYSPLRQELETKPEFVWDPVIVPIQPERLPSPSYERVAASPTYLEYEYNDDPPYCQTDHSFNQHSYPYSPGNWESSSTSSGQTIAEERLQLTYYATRGRIPSYKSSVLRDNLSWPSPESTKDSESLWTFRKFLEE